MQFKTIISNIRTPLHIAVEKGNYEIILILLNHRGTNINAQNEIAFCF